jgi:hypothetical protein
MRIWKPAALLAICVATVSTAHADTITGDISIYSAIDAVGGDSTLGTATGIDFRGSAFILDDPAPTGTFSGAEGTLVTLADFEFKPTLSPSPVSPLWAFAFGGFNYSFSLSSVVIVTQLTGFLSLEGTGLLTSSNPALEPTTATWTFTATAARDGKLTISPSVTSTTTVPEGGTTFSMLAFGLLGVGALRRRLA